MVIASKVLFFTMRDYVRLKNLSEKQMLGAKFGLYELDYFDVISNAWKHR